MNPSSRRILIVDDNRAIHDDYQKILVHAAADATLTAVEGALFDEATQPPLGRRADFELSFALQGEEAIELARAARTAVRPFALAFVDIRMPPGIDGIETAQRLWAVDPDVQVVICSAYSDYSWADMATQFGAADRWVILKKPFDNIEVLQLAHALVEKWALRQQTKAQVEELEQRVVARTVDLSGALQRLREEVAERERGEAERREIERKLEETQRLEGLGVLAGGVAHDFNNILTGVLVSASLARLDAPAGSDLQMHLQLIEENSRRAAGLCEQLLTYAGRSRVSMAALDLNLLVRESLELLHVSVPKDADFAVELAETLPSINGDAARLRQIVMNLVLNAAEALHEAPRRIRLRSGCAALDAAALSALAHPGDAQPGDFVFIEVSDTGVGISADALRRIFEPFYTTKFTGRGLGLSAVLGIMRHHRGALDVQSEVGRGTTFRAYFPVVTDQPRPPAGSAPALARGQGGTVLLADDEESVRTAAAITLRRHGFSVVTAADGVEAVALARQAPAPFAGAVLDVTMPRMDGVAAIGELRKIQPRLPVVLVTGFDARGVASQVAGTDSVWLLQKPFTLDELIRAAAEHFTSTASAPLDPAGGAGASPIDRASVPR